MDSTLASQNEAPSPAAGPPGVGPERTHWLQLGIICAASFVVWAGFGAILPYLPVFLQEEAEAPVWLIGVVAAAYYVGSFAFSAPFGRLSDSIGRKPVIVRGEPVCRGHPALHLHHPSRMVHLLPPAGGDRGGGRHPGGPGPGGRTVDGELRSRAYGWLTTAQFGGLVAGPMLAWPLYSLGGGEGKWAFYTIFLFGSALST